MTIRFAMLLLSLALLPACAAATLKLEATPGKQIPTPIRGVDVSMLDQLERSGAVFRDTGGQPSELLPLLQAGGANWVRLRLWHHPVNEADVFDDGRLLSRRGDPVGGGNNDLAATIRMATRARTLGLKLLLDFHYSDFWADPGKQVKPAAWTDLHGAQLRAAVHDYTRDTLLALRDADAYPDMVQLGNETNGGMLWPDGKTWRATPDEQIGGAAGFAELLTAAASAVRETDPNAGQADAIRIAIHLADGGDNELYRRVFDDLTTRAVDFDVIGLSYYPYFHGPISGLRANLIDMVNRYGKPVVIMETATGWTLDNADSAGNVFNSERAQAGNYSVSAKGQEMLLRDLYGVLGELPAGKALGVFWWEPGWLAMPGAGWRSGDGNGWENQAWFDFQGRALPSASAFSRIR